MPTFSEWKDIIAPTIQKHILDYLSDPYKWGSEYVLDGKRCFYDDESYKHMRNRPRSEHLVDCWEVKVTVDPVYGLHYEITNSKYVGSYNLYELLSEGTDDYWSKEGDPPMNYWYRYMDRMFGNRYHRHGIRDELVDLFNKLQKDAIDYGKTEAYKELGL